MFLIPPDTSTSTAERYEHLFDTVRHIMDGERSGLANMANVAAVLYHGLGRCNWVGFYLFDGTELVLGPFQGLPACIRIAIGRGVCGTAAAQGTSIVVPDVHTFPGHIACDAVSRSELVVPLLHHGTLLGVLDLDSPEADRFTDDDRRGCERIVDLLVAGSDWHQPLTGIRT